MYTKNMRDVLCLDRPDNHQDYKRHSKQFEYWTCPVFRCSSYVRLKLVSLAINVTVNKIHKNRRDVVGLDRPDNHQDLNIGKD